MNLAEPELYVKLFDLLNRTKLISQIYFKNLLMILRCIIYRYIIPASNNGYVYWPIICFKHVQFQYIISCNIHALHVFSNRKPVQGSIVSILCKHLHFVIQRFS